MYARRSLTVLIALGVAICATAADNSAELRAHLRELALENDTRLMSYRYHYEASVITGDAEAQAMSVDELRDADLPITHSGYYTRDGERRRSIRHSEDGVGAAQYAVDTLQYDGRSHLIPSCPSGV
jgi:hypothetical protein